MSDWPTIFYASYFAAPAWSALEYIKAFAGPVATVIASSVAGYFAYAQVQVARSQRNIAKDKLKYDLFEKRYAVYAAIRHITGNWMDFKKENGRLGKEVNNYISIVSEAQFFFDNRTMNQIDIINDKINHLTTLEAMQEALTHKYSAFSQDVTDQRIANSGKLVDAHKQLYEIHLQLPDKFASALAFEQLTKPD